MKRLVKEFLKENKFRIFIQLLFIMINMYLLTIPARIIGNIIDLFYDYDVNRVEIINSVFLLMGVSVLLLIVRLTWKYVDTLIPRSFERIIKDNIFNHFLKMKITDIQRIKNGEIMSYFVKDVSEIRLACHHLFSFVPRIVFTFIFAIYSMMQNVDFKLTIISLSPLIVAVFLLIWIREKININYARSQKDFTKLSEFLQESTDAIRTTKAYQLEDKQIEIFVEDNKQVKSSNIKVNFYSTLLSIALNTCFGLSYGVAILFGSNLVFNGIISVGDLVAFNTHIALFVSPISMIPRVVARLKRGQVSYKRLDKVFEFEEERIIIEETKRALLDIPHGENKDELVGDIVINNLSFNYKGYIEKAVSNIDLVIKQGETLGIIGNVGSGKTTLMNLLVRLYQVPRGKILINNIDINDIPISVLRENICYITQDNFLFSTTVKQNVSLFRDVEDDDVKESIKNALIYDEIMNLPNEIDTVIGERGVDLSGGQKQRLVISRAFLNRSNIVIFDDTFSALDNRTEQHLLKNIKKLTEGKTCIIISNRISDIKHADKIIVMENGEIVEKGTHKSLMNIKQKYYSFYKEQAVKKEESLLS